MSSVFVCVTQIRKGFWDMKAVRNLGNSPGKSGKVCSQNGNTQLLIHSSSKCDRPRTRSSVTIWNLPDSVLVMMLKGVHVKDLLSFRSVHPSFCDIIDNHNILWTSTSFSDCWPQESNLRHFVKASDCGNIEATIKLAVAYLYKEGLTKEDVSQIASEAATYLRLAESLTPNTFPFFWIFIRPPWAPDGSCCKVQAFKHIKEIVDKDKDRDLAFGIALTLKLQRLSVQGVSKSEERKYFELAAQQHSAAATFFSLLDVMHDEVDMGKKLEKIRLLRQLSAANILEAKLNLVRHYIQGQFGGITEDMAKDFVHEFFKSSKPTGIHITFSRGLTSDISRYILVDWLVEVVGMKDFSAHTLYLAVSLFDRFLHLRTVQRSKVQLLGVAAMVISSRFLGFDILTIREAAWLTDNSYTYHDVVRMMGELVATLKGNIRVLTIQDYVKVLLAVTGETGYSAMLVEYIAMLCLLQSEMGQYSPAEVAASCVLLSRLLMNKDNPWPEKLKEWTGFSKDYLNLCTFHIHKKCLLEGSEVDYRDTKLQAVKLRYADGNRCSVSNIEVIGHRELCRRLGVTRLVNHGKNAKAIRFRNTDELIVSPRRGKKRPRFFKSPSQSFEEEVIDRSNAATPPMKHSNVFEDSISGYDGDLEEDSDECMSDKSDNLYELTGYSDMEHPNAGDHLDESHDWDSEVSMMEDEPGESEDSDAETSFYDNLEIEDGKIVCLSSMCQSRNNMNCQESSASASCCISNCTCQQPFTLIGVSLKRQSSDQSYQQFCAKNSISSGSPPSSSASVVLSSILSPTEKFPTSFSTPSSSYGKGNIGDPTRFISCRDMNDNIVRSHSSSSISVNCDNGPINLCDDNGNYTHSFVLTGAFSGMTPEANATSVFLSQNSCARCSVTVEIVGNKANLSKKAQQIAQTTNTLLTDDTVSAQVNYSSKRANILKKTNPVTVSSFVEISCPSSQVAGLSHSCSSHKHEVASAPLSSRSARIHEMSSPASSSHSARVHEMSSPSASTRYARVHEISSPSASFEEVDVPKRFTRSSYMSYHVQSQIESQTALTETPNSHLAAKKARLDQAFFTSSETDELGSREYLNTLSDSGGDCSSRCEVNPESDSGKYFSLPSRLKRKKAI